MRKMTKKREAMKFTRYRPARHKPLVYRSLPREKRREKGDCEGEEGGESEKGKRRKGRRKPEVKMGI